MTCCTSRSAIDRMTMALGGWEKATRKLSRPFKMGNDLMLICMLCHGTSGPINVESGNTPDLVTHDPECFISIARIVLS